MELPKLSTGEIVGGAVLGTALVGLGAIAVVKSRKKKRKKASSRKGRKKISRRSKARKLKFGSKAYRKKYLKHGKKRKQRKPYTAGKGRDTSRRRIRYTRNNQPYVILASGKARFISKRSVSSSKKRKGGKY